MSSKKHSKSVQTLQALGRCMILPISVLPLAGLFLAIGATLTSSSAASIFPFLSNPSVINVLNFFGQLGNSVFSNLALLFCVSIAFGFCKDDGVAALAAVISYIAMHITIGSVLGLSDEIVAASPNYTKVLGINTLPCGTVGGIAVAIMVIFVYKRFKDIQLPMAIQFFSGKRFVLMASLVGGVFVGIMITIIYPPIQALLAAAASFVNSNQQNVGVAAFFYGAIERLLIPLGLNSVWATSIVYQFGEYVNTAGQLITGDSSIFFAQLMDGVALTAGTFMTGFFPLKLFAMPAACLAIYRSAKPSKKKMVGGIMLSAAITSFVCGITEPIEFTFIFISPLLLIVHAVLSGLGFMASALIGAHCGVTFSGGLIDLLLINVIPSAQTKWWLLIPVGIALAAAYYFSFTFIIEKFNVPIIGREEEEVITDHSTAVVTDSIHLAEKVISAYGGRENIEEVNACMSRLRIDVKNKNAVNKDELMKLGAFGVTEVGNNVQAVFGMKAEGLKEQVRAVLAKTVMVNTENESEDFSMPYTGTIFPLNEVDDAVFKEKIMGDGFAVEIEEAEIVSPFDGEIISVFPSKHAICLKSKWGQEVILHIGLDTVKLDGKGFELFVKAGDKVNKGTRLMNVDIDFIRQQGYSLVSPVVFPGISAEKYEVILLKTGKLRKGTEKIICIRAKGE